jgi:hypothetical protein
MIRMTAAGSVLAALVSLLVLGMWLPTRAAPLPGHQVRAQATPLTAVDWMNRTYATSCFADHSIRYAVHSGLGQVGGVHVQVYPPLYGDVTGDGQPEAFVPYACTGADFGGVRVFVYAGTASAPRLLGDLPAPLAGKGQTFSSIHTVTLPALTVLPQARVFTVSGAGLSATATHTCPDLQITASYRVAGGRLVPVRVTVQHAAGCLSL